LAYIIIASLLFLGGAAFYYKQRSKLAWYYGQISLESTIPNYTGSNLEQWLKEADSWKAWLPYNLAFWILVSSLFDYIFAILSIYSSFIQQKVILIAILHLFLTSIWLWWVRRNSMLYKYETKLPYFQFKKKKVSNVK
jgi:Sec-independent protein secretion pathway component TatC